MQNKEILSGKTLTELETTMQSIGEKSFRARQIYKWINKKSVHDFQKMTDLSKDLRNKLTDSFKIKTLEIQEKEHSEIDDSVKYLFKLEDGNFIESVLMQDSDRHTICLSTMIGCPIGCPYCATGLIGLKRNLTAGEIVEQLLWVAKDSEIDLTNIVFMGMGEPFLNYENSIKAAQIFNTELGPEISTRKIVISTCGIIPKLYDYTDQGYKFKLAISLNGTTNKQRDEMVPINKKYPLEELIKAAKYYTNNSRNRITFEYILIKDFNDSLEDARRLRQLLSDFPCKLNIIPYNENEQINFQAPSEQKLDQFVNELYKSPFAVTVRRSKGQDISAACGQLYGKNNI
ncbi:MAG: 23S rRNA (adenine(2503)-C(2))-methyltransferase RlmN [Candidatus Marinimicrobia bacterium]|nr:23S rRNA (adenine(2503)-C(2))-methyltransferase RlmN [Candidatus Neomarinimicrobiota bacterium]